MTQASEPFVPGEGAAPRLTAEAARRFAERLADHPVMGALPLAVLTDLIAGAACVSFAPGEMLIARGETSDYALLLMEGKAQIFIDTPYDNVHLADCEGPAVVGEVATFTGVPRTAHVQAVSAISAVHIGARALKDAGLAHPTFLEAALRQIGGRLETFNRAVGFYSSALNALERQDFDMRLLDDLRNPLPELANFSLSFRRLAEEIMVRQAYRREMASAAAIQRAMLPEPLGAQVLAGRAQIHAQMQPARDVGGDFYDIFQLADGRLVVNVGDVSGKGIPASLFMSAVQTALRYVLRQESDLAQAITIANGLLCATNSEDMFVTAFCGLVDLDTGVVDYCNCGHSDCMIIRADGTIERPKVSSIALGLAERARYRAERTVLAPGDRLFLFTDGIGDAVDLAEQAFGEDRLEAAVQSNHALPTAAFVEAVLAQVHAHSGTAPQFDDITALALTYLGRPA